MKKKNTSETLNQRLPGPGAGPGGAMAPAFFLRPGPGGAKAPAKLLGPGPGGAMAPADFFGPGPGGAMAPTDFLGPGPGGAMAPALMKSWVPTTSVLTFPPTPPSPIVKSQKFETPKTN